jgi:hypothetical protein
MTTQEYLDWKTTKIEAHIGYYGVTNRSFPKQRREDERN